MKQIVIENDFAAWRNAARTLLQGGVHPDQILWSAGSSGALFAESELKTEEKREIFVPAAFMKLAKPASCCDDPEKWTLLYRTAYRIINENRELLEIESDRDVYRLNRMKKSVNRDVHKFHAFVRFRRIENNGQEIFVAWHEPRHFTVELSAPFFVRRFGSMRFSILTPKGCAHWNLKELTFSDPVTRDRAPTKDDTEEYWLTYYRSIFNPFRLKIKAMKSEMPVRHWKTLPETVLIRELIQKEV